MQHDTHDGNKPQQSVLFMEAEEMRERLRYVSLRECPASELPIRLERKRDGVVLGSYENREKAMDSLRNLPATSYNPVRSKGRRR